MAQPLPIHSWKLIVPCEVSAVKLGASSFMRNMNCPPEAEVLYIDRPQPIDWICGPPCHLWDSSRTAYSDTVHRKAPRFIRGQRNELPVMRRSAEANTPASPVAERGTAHHACSQKLLDPPLAQSGGQPR